MKHFAGYMVTAIIIILLACFFVSNAKAETTITFPQETGVTAFWFPNSGTYAMGLAHTWIRVQHSILPKIQLDGDITIAQEVNQDKDTLLGLGVKVAYKPSKNEITGFAFEPSIGITLLNNFQKFKAFNDIYQNYEAAIYGTLLLYRW